MAERNELGKAGENVVVAYLEEHGYLICHRNRRKGRLGLDIIAVRENELVIVEMGTRGNTLFAQPEEVVDLPEIKWTVRAADAYMKLLQIDAPIRSDIITIIGENGNFRIDYIRKVFYPPLF